MTKRDREILAFMALILLDLSRGFPIDIEDMWKLDAITKELEMKGENDNAEN